MPLVLFGNGLKNKSHVKFKGLRHGASEKVYRQLRLREKLGELVLLDIDEYKTSKVKTRACKYHNTIFVSSSKMGPCSKCHVTPISTTRNKRKICKSRSAAL